METEKQLVENIGRYLQLQYSDIIYRFDIAADLKLTMGQAAKHKRIQGRTRGYPDLFIAEPRGGFSGLYLELKAESKSPYKKDGTLKKSDHLAEQQTMLDRLQAKGYEAKFSVGFEETQQNIDQYMKLPID